MQYIPVTLVSSSFDIFEETIGKTAEQLPDEVSIDGVGSLSNFKLETTPGMTRHQIVLSFAIGIASGLTLNIASTVTDWLVKKFLTRETIILIGDDPVRKASQEELERAIEAYLDKKQQCTTVDSTAMASKDERSK